jgi:hypothetical protein
MSSSFLKCFVQSVQPRSIAGTRTAMLPRWRAMSRSADITENDTDSLCEVEKPRIDEAYGHHRCCAGTLNQGRDAGTGENRHESVTRDISEDFFEPGSCDLRQPFGHKSHSVYEYGKSAKNRNGKLNSIHVVFLLSSFFFFSFLFAFHFTKKQSWKIQNFQLKRLIMVYETFHTVTGSMP